MEFVTPTIDLLSLIVDSATNPIGSGVWAHWLGSLVQIVAACKQALGTHLYNKEGCYQICIILIPKTVEVAVIEMEKMFC